MTPDPGTEKFESFQRINSIRETNRSFDSCNSCKRLVPSRLHELQSQNVCLFHVSNIYARNFLFFCSCIRGQRLALHSTPAAPWKWTRHADGAALPAAPAETRTGDRTSLEQHSDSSLSEQAMHVIRSGTRCSLRVPNRMSNRINGQSAPERKS